MFILKEVAESGNLSAGLKAACEVFKDRIVQIYKAETRQPGEYANRVSFGDYYKKTVEVAAGLAADGAAVGNMVCVLSENRPEWNIADHALLMNRCVTVGIYTNDSTEHIKYKINDTGSTAIFIEDEGQWKKLKAIPASEIPTLKRIYVFDSNSYETDDNRVMAFSTLVGLGVKAGAEGAAAVEESITKIKPSDVVRIVYTSGTSGNPKGVMLTHNNIFSNVVSTSERVGFNGVDDMLISFLPEAHSFQTLLTYALILNGGALGYSFRKTLIPDLLQLRPTLMPGVQKVWSKIQSGVQAMTGLGMGKPAAEEPKIPHEVLQAKLGMDKIRWFVSGAGKLEPYTYNFFKNYMGIKINLGYGLSETSPAISVNFKEAHRFGSSGKPITGQEVKIVDAERDEIPVGETGEIAVRGPNVFVGYYNHEDKYRAVVDSEGWFYTGDRGYMDEDGFLYVLGRAGHRVKFSDGEHHDLEEIGSRILGHTKYIQQIAVYGEGKDFPIAIVSLTDEDDDLKRMAQQVGIEYTDRDEFAYDPKVTALCEEDFKQACEAVRKTGGIQGIEDVKKGIYIRPMSEDNGEKTPTQKTRLNLILSKYESAILKLYEADEDFVVLKV